MGLNEKGLDTSSSLTTAKESAEGKNMCLLTYNYSYPTEVIRLLFLDIYIMTISAMAYCAGLKRTWSPLIKFAATDSVNRLTTLQSHSKREWGWSDQLTSAHCSGWSSQPPPGWHGPCPWHESHCWTHPVLCTHTHYTSCPTSPQYLLLGKEANRTTCLSSNKKKPHSLFNSIFWRTNQTYGSNPLHQSSCPWGWGSPWSLSQCQLPAALHSAQRTWQLFLPHNRWTTQTHWNFNGLYTLLSLQFCKTGSLCCCRIMLPTVALIKQMFVSAHLKLFEWFVPTSHSSVIFMKWWTEQWNQPFCQQIFKACGKLCFWME